MRAPVVLQIARREWLEQRRQPAMLASMAVLFAVISGVVILGIGTFQIAHSDPGTVDKLNTTLPAMGVSPDLKSLAAMTLSAGNWLMFTQFLGMTGVFAGHSLLHDRELHTLPFLLLTPTRRSELLTGKILGALGFPLAAYLVCTLLMGIIGRCLSITQDLAAELPPSGAWLATFLVGGPAWATFIATLGAWISFHARDVRTAQQLVWFVLFFATMICGTLLLGQLSQGVWSALGAAIFGLGCAFVTATATIQSMNRDLRR